MQENDGEEIINLLKAIHIGIRKHGLRKIVKSLSCLDIGQVNENNLEALNYIKTIVCKALKVEPYLLYGFDARGNVTTARKICMLLFRKHLSISAAEAAQHFNRSRQIAHNAENELDAMSDKNPQDRGFMQLYNTLDVKISEWMIKTLKQQQDGEQGQQRKQRKQE